MVSNLQDFIATVARLRAPGGCPWDREQTHASLAKFLLEEVYEVLETIHANDDEKLKEELGDLLLQIVLHAQIASESGSFNLEDVASEINEKMLRRHPHVFGNAIAATPEAVLMQWDELKAKEKVDKDQSVMADIPSAMPALLQALKVSQRAVREGFEWQQEADIWQTLESELDELKEAIAELKDKERISELPERDKLIRKLQLEMGDVLFTLVNIARWHALDPEEALLLATQKFKRRFMIMEKMAAQPLSQYSFKELEDLWHSVKKQEVSPLV